MKSKTKQENLRIRNIFLGLFLIATIVVAGCSSPVTPGNNEEVVYNQEGLLGDTGVKENSFKSTEEYSNFVKDHVSYYGGVYYSRSSGIMKSAESLDVAVAPTASAGDGSVDYSGTNNQVEGVDEADMLKTDGEYVYTITDNVVFIIKAYPGKDAEVVSKIKFDGNMPTSLFIEGDKLAVIGYVNDFEFLNDRGFSRDQGYLFMNVYDVGDRSSPELVKELKFEGQYNNARLMNGYVYLISTFYPQYDNYPIPVMFEGNVKKEMDVRSIHYFNIPYSNPYLVVVNSVNLDSLETADSEAVTVEGYPTVYMSEDNLYLTYTEYINEWEIQQDITMDIVVPKLSSEDKAFIEKVKNTDNDILSSYEKKAKIINVVERYMSSLPEKERDALQEEVYASLKKKLEEYKYMEYTIINKLSVESGAVSVDANGKVPGHVSSQFSMDEFEGNFRVATTISQRWSAFFDAAVSEEVSSSGDIASSKVAAQGIMPRDSFSESVNNLYVLNSELDIIGSIEGLAKGEQIYGVRFMGERAYVVTFRQIDPFFAIDLKDPFSPKVLGELKIPGFSRYLHPYDDNTIIGIGRDATESGRQEGLKISLFDVTDIENPKEVAKYVSEDKYASSTVEWEHKAFLFSKEKSLLVMPIYSYSYDYFGGKENAEDMNGALVFKIDKSSIILRGLIDHSGDNKYGPSVERSLYIEDMLYTKSPYLLRINELSDLSSVKNITLSVKDTSSIPVY